MSYVDGYVLPVPKKKLPDYLKLARRAGKIWVEHGALEYRESVGEDMRIKGCTSFLDGTEVEKGETIIFAFVVYKSRAHRDKVNAKVMKDPRITKGLDMSNIPFDMKRMLYGGFKTVVKYSK